MTQYLTLYLDLEKNTQPDLEVIARASIEFSRLVRELAQNIDPTANVQLTLESGTEGSLKLNTIIKSLQGKALDAATYKKLIIGATCFLGGAIFNEVADRYVGEGVDLVLGQEEALTPADLLAIQQICNPEHGNSSARKYRENFYKELQGDSSIIGVGVTPVYNARPSKIVPQSEFRKLSASPVVEMTETTREGIEIVDVVLISPVLLESARKWRFKGEGPEFGAQIKDRDFLKSVVNGSYHLEMKGGLKMTIELERKEVAEDGVWKTVELNVLKVLKSESGATQLNLLSDD